MADIEFQPWDEFLDGFDWRQGEHVTLIGPTGAGKTTLAQQILPRRDYVLTLATKPRDTSLDRFGKQYGYRTVRKYSDVRIPRRLPGGRIMGDQKVILWPKVKDPSDFAEQESEFHSALANAYATGGWAINADELYYLVRLSPRIKADLETLWTQGRSLGISLIGGTQRPAFIPLFAYDQATHLFFWSDSDRRNLDRISGLGGMNETIIRDAVARLPRRMVLYVNTRTRTLARTRLFTTRKAAAI